MTNLAKLAAASFALALTAGTAFAQVPAFEQADANADGVVSMEEAKVALPDAPEATLVAADADNDGALSPAEYEALTAS